jgi:hypothetical protein
MTIDGQPSDSRLLLRFAIGALRVGRDRLVEELRAVPPPDAVEASPLGLRHPLIGALVAAPATFATVGAAGRRVLGAAARVLRPLSNVGLWIFGRHPIRRELVQLRARVDIMIQRLAILGLAEEAAGRELAEAALARIYVEAMDWLGDSRQLRELIQESSAGLSRGMMTELRRRSANADAHAEDIVRKLKKRM